MTKLHPRPRLTRDAWIDLTGAWGFAFDDGERGLAEGWQQRTDVFDRVIDVPFPPESEASGIGEKGYHPVVWYRREADRPAIGDNRLLLHFGAVDYRATIWVNGQLAAQHEGGHTPFSADITALLGDGETIVIVVRAEDRPLDGEQPRGKQDWQEEPHAIWYHRTSGIWQPVWMEPVPDLHVIQVQFVPDIFRGSVEVEVTLNRTPDTPVECEIDLLAGGERLARSRITSAADTMRTTLSLPQMRHGQARAHLVWSPESPNLIDVALTLEAAGAASDTCRSYFGMCRSSVADGRFLINDKPVFMRSVLEQGFWPRSHLAAPGEDALKREVELIKELGFNAVRIHEKVEDPRFLYWCDRLGLMVWDEMPSAYVFSNRMMKRLTAEWLEVVERDRSHPCVVAWVPINESWGVGDIAGRPDQQSFASALYHLTRALDPTRPVISNDGWEHTTSDILSIHDYSVRGDHLAERYGDPQTVRGSLGHFGPQRRRLSVTEAGPADRPVMITEFGGISHHPASGEKWFGYGTVTSGDEYLSVLSGLFDALHDSPAIAGYCYTQLTDTLQEKNGLLDEDRNPKLPIAKLREIIARPSNAVPAEYLDQARKNAES